MSPADAVPLHRRETPDGKGSSFQAMTGDDG